MDKLGHWARIWAMENIVGKCVVIHFGEWPLSKQKNRIYVNSERLGTVDVQINLDVLAWDRENANISEGGRSIDRRLCARRMFLWAEELKTRSWALKKAEVVSDCDDEKCLYSVGGESLDFSTPEGCGDSVIIFIKNGRSKHCWILRESRDVGIVQGVGHRWTSRGAATVAQR